MTLANSSTSTSKQGKYLTFDKAYLRHVENSGSASSFVLFQLAISTQRGIITFLSHDLHVNGQWSQGIRSELVFRLADDLASLEI